MEIALCVHIMVQRIFLKYLWIYWTDFHNLSPYESAFADDGSVPYFPICHK